MNQVELRAAAARLMYGDNRDTADYNMLIDFIDKIFKLGFLVKLPDDKVKELVNVHNSADWIPVSERLPAEWWHIGDDTHEAEPMEFIVFIEGALVPTVMYFNGKLFIDESGISYNVTHWRSMPEPPKED